MILQAVLSLRSNAERKVRTTQSNALPNGKDPGNTGIRKVPQKITALALPE